MELTTVESNITLSGLEAHIEDIGLAAFILRAVYITAVVILIFTNNTIIILVIQKTASLQCNTGCLMKYLAVTDYAIGIQAVVSLLSMLNAGFIFPAAVCKVCSFLSSIAVSMTIYILTLMSIDRYILIGYPLKYPQLITKRRVHVAMVIMFIMAFALQSYSFTQDLIHYDAHAYVCTISYQSFPYVVLLLIGILCPGLGFSIMALCYIRIYFISRSHRKRMELVKGKQGNESCHNSRALKTIFVTVGVFAVLWLPSCIHWLVVSFSSSTSLNSHSEFIMKWLIFSNSYMNMFIYYKTNKSFKAGFRKLFRMKTDVKEVNVSRDSTLTNSLKLDTLRNKNYSVVKTIELHQKIEQSLEY